ncbi:hypothetical protein HED55_18110 [Ochrobactrum haematophilum]|uniref:Uncharacterized protein n=1 Tax=Brucella haematophila TaxID=419474 RepID=A0ABX1DQS4_9HYPH|nr:hypothetical protein [Brucella haematophila]
MSMWQFMAAVDGYVTANSTDDGGLSKKEKRRALGVGERGVETATGDE